MIKNTITSALIGKKLSYSLSQIIHAHYKNNNYALIETDNFFKIFEDNQFFALSVTNPYKQDAYNFCTIHDEIATKTIFGMAITPIIMRLRKCLKHIK